VFEPIFNVPGDPLYILTPDHSPGEPEYAEDKKAYGDGQLDKFKASRDTFKAWKERVAQYERDRFEPEITINSRHLDDDFIIIACDGIWDCLNNEDCVQVMQ
jgi:serine/threonine protein phosphatase PrpC